MNTILNYIDYEDENVKRISVDMTHFDVKEVSDEKCIIFHKIESEKQYEVTHSFAYLHSLSNGFMVHTLN